MKQKVYVFVFDDLSDWEIPYALWAITIGEKQLDTATQYLTWGETAYTQSKNNRTT